MIVFHDIMKRLSENGWSSYRLVNEQIFGNSTITRIRNGQPINPTTIDTICRLCNCQPGDLMHYEDPEGED